jgi:hypothetical protein
MLGGSDSAPASTGSAHSDNDNSNDRHCTNRARGGRFRSGLSMSPSIACCYPGKKDQEGSADRAYHAAMDRGLLSLLRDLRRDLEAPVMLSVLPNRAGVLPAGPVAIGNPM